MVGIIAYMTIFTIQKRRFGNNVSYIDTNYKMLNTMHFYKALRITPQHNTMKVKGDSVIGQPRTNLGQI